MRVLIKKLFTIWIFEYFIVQDNICYLYFCLLQLIQTMSKEVSILLSIKSEELFLLYTITCSRHVMHAYVCSSHSRAVWSFFELETDDENHCFLLCWGVPRVCPYNNEWTRCCNKWILFNKNIVSCSEPMGVERCFKPSAAWCNDCS